VITTVDLSEEILRDSQVLLSTDNTTVVSFSSVQQLSGRNSLSLVVPPCDATATEAGQYAHGNEGKTHPRVQKHVGGLSLEKGKDYLHGVDTSSGDIPSDLLILGHRAHHDEHYVLLEDEQNVHGSPKTCYNR
jgi:hypothetical protein